jgi:DNA mismatch repair protein MutL
MHYKGAFIEVGKTGHRRAERFVHGLLAPPEASVSAAAGLRLFVNGRPVKDRMMTHAAAEGMRGFLTKNAGPAGFLHLHIPVDEVDVNVHPAKHEVRFRSTQDVHELIRQAVHLAMQELQGTIRTEIFPLPRRFEPSGPAEGSPGPAPVPPVRERPPQPHLLRYPPRMPSPEKPDEGRSPAAEDPSPAFPSPLRTAEPGPAQSAETAKTPPETPVQGHGLQVIGQFRDLYIFCQSGDGLVIIDQHAAHERLLFERLRCQFLQGRVASQGLLFPVTVELSLLQSRLVEKNAAEIERLGFSVREFGGNTHIISAVPALTGACEPGRLFLDILERFGSDTGHHAGAGRLEDILADMACKAAVRSGDRLAPEEIDALLTRMAAADLFSHCPHGRPVIKHFQAEEIKKWFYRP